MTNETEKRIELFSSLANLSKEKHGLSSLETQSIAVGVLQSALATARDMFGEQEIEIATRYFHSLGAIAIGAGPDTERHFILACVMCALRAVAGGESAPSLSEALDRMDKRGAR